MPVHQLYFYGPEIRDMYVKLVLYFSKVWQLVWSKPAFSVIHGDQVMWEFMLSTLDGTPWGTITTSQEERYNGLQFASRITGRADGPASPLRAPSTTVLDIHFPQVYVSSASHWLPEICNGTEMCKKRLEFLPYIYRMLLRDFRLPSDQVLRFTKAIHNTLPDIHNTLPEQKHGEYLFRFARFDEVDQCWTIQTYPPLIKSLRILLVYTKTERLQGPEALVEQVLCNARERQTNWLDYVAMHGPGDTSTRVNEKVTVMYVPRSKDLIRFAIHSRNSFEYSSLELGVNYPEWSDIVGPELPS